MTFKRLMYNNFKSNIKHIKIFLWCCILCVSVLFSYSTLIFNESLMKAFANENFVVLFKISHVVLAVFALFFISYTINTYLKNKKREYALMQLLGSDLASIKRRMFLENAIILGLSYILGCLIGLVCSSGYFLVFKYLLNYETLKFQIGFINFFSTFAIFALIFVLESLVGMFLIQKISPLVLMNKMTQKPCKSFGGLSLLGVAAIVFAYSYLHDHLNNPEIAIQGQNPYPVFFLTLFTGVLLMIYNFDALYFKFVKLRRHYYFKNILSISQLRGHLNQSRKVMFILTLMTFLIVSLLSTALSTYVNSDDTASKTQPFHLVVSMPNEEGLVTAFDESLKTVAGNRLKEGASYAFFEGKQTIKLSHEDLSEKTFVQDVVIISENTYNALMGTDLHVDFQAYYSHLNDLNQNISNVFPYEDTIVTINNNDFVLTFKGQSRQPIVNSELLESKIFVVVNHQLFESLSKDYGKALMVYNFELREDAEQIMEAMGPISSKVVFSTALQNMDKQKQETGTRFFIVLFISLLFIIAAISVQKMKLVSERHFYKERYLKLNAIGITEKQMIRALNMEFKIVMIAPYVLGALLGYLYIVISSFYTPVFMYFARDLFGFILIFLVFEWSIYVVSFKRFYKSIIK